MGASASLLVTLLIFFMSVSFSPIVASPVVTSAVVTSPAVTKLPANRPTLVKVAARPAASQNGEIQAQKSQEVGEHNEQEFESGTLFFGDTEILTTIVDFPDQDPDKLAYQLAIAMDITPSLIHTAEFVCNNASGGCSDPRGAAVLGIAPGTWFPTRNSSFTLLSTGLATDVVHIPDAVQLTRVVTSSTHSNNPLLAVDLLPSATITRLIPSGLSDLVDTVRRFLPEAWQADAITSWILAHAPGDLSDLVDLVRQLDILPETLQAEIITRLLRSREPSDFRDLIDTVRQLDILPEALQAEIITSWIQEHAPEDLSNLIDIIRQLDILPEALQVEIITRWLPSHEPRDLREFIDIVRQLDVLPEAAKLDTIRQWLRSHAPNNLRDLVDFFPQIDFAPYVTTTTEVVSAFVLDGMNNSLGEDWVQLHLALEVPQGAQCLSYDYTFYTTEFPNANDLCIGNLGDLFTTQLNDSRIFITHSDPVTDVVAPGNFVTYAGDYVATTTMSPTGVQRAISSPLGTTVPGIFPLLQARQRVTAGEIINLYFSIQDMVTSFGNSAVALDNFFWLTSTVDCQSGISGDKDSDGLPDGWEIHGKYTRDRDDELKFFDLPGWGANPTIKDIFVEVDTMLLPTGITKVQIYEIDENATVRPIADPVKTDIRPISEAISYVVTAFANAPVDEIPSDDPTKPKEYKGIHLHVDFGPEVPPRWMTERLRARWPELSQGQIFTEALRRAFVCDMLCKDKSFHVWKEVQKIKYDHAQFADERVPIFHYALFAHMITRCTLELNNSDSDKAICAKLPKLSGASNHITEMVNGGSDFVVTLGHSLWYTSDAQQSAVRQAGTFMHELGHNLGLNHEGTYNEEYPVMYKPNHLSVMNYLYQTRGVLTDLPFKFDYSRYDFSLRPFSLDENALNEANGINLKKYSDTYHISIPMTISISHKCEGKDKYRSTDSELGQPIDWDCDYTLTESTFEYDISGYGEDEKYHRTELAPDNEWDRLTFSGGLLNRQQSMINKYNDYLPHLYCLDPDRYIAELPRFTFLDPSVFLPILWTLVGNQSYFPPNQEILPANDFLQELTTEIEALVR